MSDPKLLPPATADETRILEIQRTWEGLDDAVLEEALTEVRDLALRESVRYGYQQLAHAVAETIDAQFVDAPYPDTDQPDTGAPTPDADDDVPMD